MENLKTNEDSFLRELEFYGIFKNINKKDFLNIEYLLNNSELDLHDYMLIRDILEFSNRSDDSIFASILISLFSALSEGSLCLDLTPDFEKNRFSERFPPEIRKKSEEILITFLDGVQKQKYKSVLSINRDEFLPLIFVESNGKKLLYFQKFFIHEAQLKKHMDTLYSAKNSTEISDTGIKSLIDSIYSDNLALRVGLEKKVIQKDFYQVEAIELTLKNQFSIISGGPGTGKTSLMVNILRCLTRTGISPEQIELAAPTGRASQRMTEAVQKNIGSIDSPSMEDKSLLNLNGTTLHKVLKYSRFKNDFFHNEANPLEASVIIVDEVSMVDLILLEKLIRSVNPLKTKVIFLGDKDQLPSVDAGSVFADMISDKSGSDKFRDKLVVLQNVYRSGKNLLQLSQKINSGELPEITPDIFNDVTSDKPDEWFLIKPDKVQWKEHLKKWTDYYYLNSENDGKNYKELIQEVEQFNDLYISNPEKRDQTLDSIFLSIENVRILTLIRKGIYGAVGINTLISEYMRESLDKHNNRRDDVYSGQQIIITRNDHSKNLYNGDIGVIIKEINGLYRGYFKNSDQFIDFPVDLLPPFETSFAMTVHKSQGSEFENVMVVLPEDKQHRLLSREIIYTGITRAKKRVTIYGSETALQNGLNKKIHRQSGLDW